MYLAFIGRYGIKWERFKTEYIRSKKQDDFILFFTSFHLFLVSSIILGLKSKATTLSAPSFRNF